MHGQTQRALLLGQATAKQLAIVRLYSPYQSCEDHFCGENDHKKDKSVRKEVKPLGTLLSGHHRSSPRFDARMGTRDSLEQSTLEIAAVTRMACGRRVGLKARKRCRDASVAGTMRLVEVKVDHYFFQQSIFEALSMVGSAQGNRAQELCER
jgi:hypothetical protein